MVFFLSLAFLFFFRVSRLVHVTYKCSRELGKLFSINFYPTGERKWCKYTCKRPRVSYAWNIRPPSEIEFVPSAYLVTIYNEFSDYHDNKLRRKSKNKKKIQFIFEKYKVSRWFIHEQHMVPLGTLLFGV